MLTCCSPEKPRISVTEEVQVEGLRTWCCGQIKFLMRKRMHVCIHGTESSSKTYKALERLRGNLCTVSRPENLNCAPISHRRNGLARRSELSIGRKSASSAGTRILKSSCVVKPNLLSTEKIRPTGFLCWSCCARRDRMSPKP